MLAAIRDFLIARDRNPRAGSGPVRGCGPRLGASPWELGAQGLDERAVAMILHAERQLLRYQAHQRLKPTLGGRPSSTGLATLRATRWDRPWAGCSSELEQRLVAWIALPALNPADVGAVKPGYFEA
jgi:hypothetical protein